MNSSNVTAPRKQSQPPLPPEIQEEMKKAKLRLLAQKKRERRRMIREGRQPELRFIMYDPSRLQTQSSGPVGNASGDTCDSLLITSVTSSTEQRNTSIGSTYHEPPASRATEYLPLHQGTKATPSEPRSPIHREDYSLVEEDGALGGLSVGDGPLGAEVGSLGYDGDEMDLDMPMAMSPKNSDRLSPLLHTDWPPVPGIQSPRPVPDTKPTVLELGDVLQCYRHAFPFGFGAVLPRTPAAVNLPGGLLVLEDSITHQLPHLCSQIGPAYGQLQRIYKESHAGDDLSQPASIQSQHHVSVYDLENIATQWLWENGHDAEVIKVVCLMRSPLFADPAYYYANRIPTTNPVVTTHRVWVFDGGETERDGVPLSDRFLKVQRLDPERLGGADGFSPTEYTSWGYIHPSTSTSTILDNLVPNKNVQQCIWDTIHAIRIGSKIHHEDIPGPPWNGLKWHGGDALEESYPPPRQETADYTLEIIRRFPGCPETKHNDAASRHESKCYRHPSDSADAGGPPLQANGVANDTPSKQGPEEVRRCCCSISEITSTLRRGVADVLATNDIGECTWPDSSTGFQAAFEGTTPLLGPEPPRLSMERWHGPKANKMPSYKVSFDYDSIMGFIRSLAAVKDNISWFADMYPEKNLSQDLHLTVHCPIPTSHASPRGHEQPTNAYKSRPIHLVPHYIAGYFNKWGHYTKLYFIFPRLYRFDLDAPSTTGMGARRVPSHYNTMRAQDFRLWLEEVLLLAIVLAVNDSSLLAPFPESLLGARSRTNAPAEYSRISRSGRLRTDDLPAGNKVSLDVFENLANMKASRTESMDPSEEDPVQPNARRQYVSYMLQSGFLDRVQKAIELIIASDDGQIKEKFSDFRMFVDSKNCKGMDIVCGGPAQEEVDASFKCLGQSFWKRFLGAFDTAHIDPDEFYVDVGKEFVPKSTMTTGDSAGVDASAESQTFLWRKCCLKRMKKDREKWAQAVASPPGVRQRSPTTPLAQGPGVPAGHIKQELSLPDFRWFPFATIDEAACLTAVASPDGADRSSGWLASKYYNSNKNIFDANKKSPFVWLKDLALGDAYKRAHASAGGARAIDRPVLEKAYRRTKERVHQSLHDARQSTGSGWAIRQEETLSLNLFKEVLELLSSRASVPHAGSGGTVEVGTIGLSEANLPVFVVPTAQMCDFLRAQFNRHLHLIEFLYEKGRNRTGTGPAFTVQQTAMMSISFRLLPFCYSSSVTETESTLYRMMWAQNRVVAKADCEGERTGEPGSISDGSTSDGSTSDGNTSDGSISDGSISDGSISDGSISDGSISDGSISAEDSEEEEGSLYRDSDLESEDSRASSAVHAIAPDHDGWPLLARCRDRRHTMPVVRQGLGLNASMKKYGFGWWQPNILQWHIWTFGEEVLHTHLDGNILPDSKHGRTSENINTFGNDELLISQALSSWPDRYTCILEDRKCFRSWVDYLICLVIFFFRRDTWSTVLRAESRHPVFRDDKREEHSEHNPPSFCWDGLARLYKEQHGLPHCPNLVLNRGTSNTSISPHEHVEEQFWGQIDSRRNKFQFRTVLRRVEDEILTRLGQVNSRRQNFSENPETEMRRFRTLLIETVIVTHWLLPASEEQSFRRRRPCWISSALLPSKPKRWRHIRKAMDFTIAEEMECVELQGEHTVGSSACLRQSLVQSMLNGRMERFMPSELDVFNRTVLTGNGRRVWGSVDAGSSTKGFRRTLFVEAGEPPELEACLIISRYYTRPEKIEGCFELWLTRPKP